MVRRTLLKVLSNSNNKFKSDMSKSFVKPLVNEMKHVDMITKNSERLCVNAVRHAGPSTRSVPALLEKLSRSRT